MKDKVDILANTSPTRSGWIYMPLGLLFMGAASVIVHSTVNPDALESRHFLISIMVAIAAHVGGYLGYRRFDIFPGMAAKGALLPTFLLSYAAALTFILLLRLDYSRLQLVVSFLASVTWYFAAAQLDSRLRPYRLAVVPGGHVPQLNKTRQVSWTIITTPTAVPRGFHGIVVDLRADLSDAWERFIADCALSGTPVYHVKQVVESLTGRVQIEHLSENTLGSLNPNRLFIGLKNACDWLTALVILTLVSPLLFLTAVAIRLDSPGPALFRQRRVGYGGQVFTVFKFRTMRDDAGVSEQDGRQSAMTLDRDARVTRAGAFLRRTRIDELPQLLNILRGEMSWIGPRPEALPLARWYEAELPFYRYRHIVKPGITGWAQVNQGHVTRLDDVREKLHYDFYYIKNISWWLDMSIICRTIAIVLTGFGAK